MSRFRKFSMGWFTADEMSSYQLVMPSLILKISGFILSGYLLIVPPISAAGLDAFPGELLLFPHLTATHLSGLPSTSDEDENDKIIAIDIFYAKTNGRFKILGEYFWDKAEHELERFHIGWSPRQGTTFWLGRFHNPVGYWNTAFHHGKYLQTTLSRPGIADFEDDGGPLPIHLSGFLSESEHYIDDAMVALDAALGLGPQYDGEEAVPLDLLDPGKGSQKGSAILRVRYYPEYGMESHIGAFIGHTRIEGDNAVIRGSEQTQSGVFGVWEDAPWLYSAAFYYIRDSVDSFPAGSTSGSFTNAWLQAEYVWDSDWTFFARTENSFNEDRDPWLALIPGFVQERNLAGVRYDVGINQSVTLEVSRDITSTEKTNHYVLQWAGVFP